MFSLWKAKQVGKTDMTDVLVSVFKISSAGSKYMGHLGEVQFFFSQPPFGLL